MHKRYLGIINIQNKLFRMKIIIVKDLEFIK